MRNWLKSQADYWLSCLPPIDQRDWLEKQVAKYLDIDNEEWVNPLRTYLFVFWIYRYIFRAIKNGSKSEA